MIDSATNENLQIINQIKEELPSYHNHAHRQAFINRCGRVAAGIKSHVLRQIYREITGILPPPLSLDGNYLLHTFST